MKMYTTQIVLMMFLCNSLHAMELEVQAIKRRKQEKIPEALINNFTVVSGEYTKRACNDGRGQLFVGGVTMANTVLGSIWGGLIGCTMGPVPYSCTSHYDGTLSCPITQERVDTKCKLWERKGWPYGYHWQCQPIYEPSQESLDQQYELQFCSGVIVGGVMLGGLTWLALKKWYFARQRAQEKKNVDENFLSNI